MRFTFEAKLEALGGATERITAALTEAGCPVKVLHKLLIALDEIASNIIRYSGASNYTVDIEFPEDPDAVVIEFSDAGKAFNPLTEAPEPDVTKSCAEREIGGLGMFMVKRLMDNVSYRHENGLNILTISKLRVV